MMNIWMDKNRSWTPPVGARLAHVTAVGSFIRLTYIYDVPSGQVGLDVYLNDQGREVGQHGYTFLSKEKSNGNQDRKSESKPRS
jgi:hypothetical protein